MNRKQMKLISRGLDSELDREEREALEELLKKTPEAGDAARVWGIAGDCLREESMRIPVQDSELAWLDIRRTIRLGEEAEDNRGLVMTRLRWISGVASILFLLLLGWSGIRVLQGLRAPLAALAPPERVEWAVPGISGAATMIYTDTETDLTVIWLDIGDHERTSDS